MSDFHSMTFTVFRSQFTRQKPIKIQYRDYSRSDADKFLRQLNDEIYRTSAVSEDCPDIAYNTFAEKFCNTINKHAPLKNRTIRGNQAPFVNKELAKAIMTRSRLKNTFIKDKNKQNWQAFAKQRNKCTKLRKKAIKSHFAKVTGKGTMTDRCFWKTVKPFLNSKGNHGQQTIILEENNKIHENPTNIAEIFNNCFVNIVEITTGKPPPSHQEKVNISEVLDRYSTHPSIWQIKSKFSNKMPFSIPFASEEEVYDIISSIDTTKGAGYDKIPAKLIQMSAGVITKPITNIINLTIQTGTFPELLKTATVSPVFKKEDPLSKENYRPISVLTVFSKIFERYYQSKLLPYFNRIMSDKLSAYRRNYSSQHVLLRLIENWRRCLDENKVVGAVLMDLSKAFDCLSHELLIAKLEAYGFNENTIKLVYSYLTNRKQSVKIKGSLSALKRILSGVPQGSILGPMLFNIFINDLFYIVGEENLHNFADDNTVSDNALSLNELIQQLQTLTESTISWFDQNNMIANPSKFHAIIIRKDRKNTEGIEININGKVLKQSQRYRYSASRSIID